MDLHSFIEQYTEQIYHQQDVEALARFVADPCIRHEHGHQVVMSLAENKARVAGFLASVRNPRFSFVTALAEGNLYAGAYQFKFATDDGEKTVSGIEIFKVEGGLITETWNTAGGDGAWG